MSYDSENWQGYEWTALSVTTVGALARLNPGFCPYYCLAGHLNPLQANFLTIMWVLLGYLLITTAGCTRRRTIGRYVRAQEPIQCRLCHLHLRFIALRSVSVPVQWLAS